jgi:hypothetical protein
MGRNAMAFIRRLRDKGVGDAIQHARKIRRNRTVLNQSGAGQDYRVDVAPWLVDRFPAEQWALLHGVDKSK